MALRYKSENVKWFRKNRMTINAKLRQAIMDALPFDIDQKQADVILRAVFQKIVEGAVVDGFVTIEGLGRFYKHRMRSKRHVKGVRGKTHKYVTWKLHWLPERYRLAFTPCRSLKYSLRDEEPDGNSGTE